MVVIKYSLMKIIRLLLSIFLSGFVFRAQGGATVAPASERILFISSNQAGQAANQRMSVSFIQQFRSAPFKMELEEIYLGAKKVLNAEERRRVLDSCLRDIKGDMDLIVASDEEAAAALFSLNIPLTREIPVIFCGMTDYRCVSGRDNVTGVVYPVDYERVFLSGRKLFPEVQQVYVYSDRTEEGQVQARLARKQLEKYTKDFPLYFVSDTTMGVDAFASELQNIFPLSFVILTTWQQGENGDYLNPDIYYATYANESAVPVFTAFDRGLGKGVFGGYVTTLGQQGTRLGEMAVDVLKGKSVRSIPVDTLKPVHVFDDNLLRMWRLKHSELPSDKVILNNRGTFWITYKTYIVAICLVFCVLVFMLVCLVLYQLRYRKMLRRSGYLEKAAQQMATMLKEKTEILSNTLSSMSEGILVVDKELRIIELNRATVEGLGLAGKIIGKPLHEVCEVARDKVGHGIEELAEGVMREKARKDLALDTVLIPGGDAPIQKVAGSISPLLNFDNEVYGAVIMFRDITREWQQQKFLRISVNALQAFSWYYDVENDILNIGEGFAEDEFVKENLNTLNKFVAHIHPDDRDSVISVFQGVLEGKMKEFAIECRVDFSRTGNYHWWASRGVMEIVVMADGKKVQYLYGMGISIDKHKQAEEELASALRRAEESDRLKSAFVANISHEIRTPLNSIVGFTNLMTEEGYSDEERKLFRDSISNNSRDLLGLLDDVLDLSRLEAGQETCYPGVCDMRFLVHSVLDIGHLNAAEGVEFIERGPREELLVITDEIKLTKVFLNLVRNAKKFTSRGHVAVGAKVSDDGNWIECFVEDTGIGISKESLGRVFDRFFKANEFVQGTGLGLPICKAIIELLGGEIYLTSEPGKGTTVYFRIPYKRPETV